MQHYGLLQLMRTATENYTHNMISVILFFFLGCSHNRSSCHTSARDWVQWSRVCDEQSDNTSVCIRHWEIRPHRNTALSRIETGDQNLDWKIYDSDTQEHAGGKQTNNCPKSHCQNATGLLVMTTSCASWFSSHQPGLRNIEAFPLRPSPQANTYSHCSRSSC